MFTRATALSSALRATSRPVVASRAFRTTTAAPKSLTDSVKDTASSINKKVGETLSSGLESAESVAGEAGKKTGECFFICLPSALASVGAAIPGILTCLPDLSPTPSSPRVTAS